LEVHVIFTETKLKGAYIIEIDKLRDQRGFFARMWCKNEFEAHGLNPNIVQVNLSFNKQRGIIRGLHYQKRPYEEAKLFRCIRGAIYDVIIDLRPKSPTFLEWAGFELTADNRKMLYVPESFAQGYQALVDDTEVFYQVSQFYSPDFEQGIRYDDPAFGIEWPVTNNLLVSDKDTCWPDYVPG
jgi:dTDP-4-dehydrorhamnose 3,5-epimerase